jgi:Ala-tRNA(Pro) deacylase
MKPMRIAITLAQYLFDHGAAYELVPHLRTETALASAAASGLLADRIVKAVVVKGADGFKLALLPTSRYIKFDELWHVLGTDIARQEPVETLFGDCEPGSVPVLDAAYGLDVVVDDSLAEQPDLYLEGATTAIWSVSPRQVFRS